MVLNWKQHPRQSYYIRAGLQIQTEQRLLSWVPVQTQKENWFVVFYHCLAESEWLMGVDFATDGKTAFRFVLTCQTETTHAAMRL
jgi:hypothetical protein